MRLHNAIETTCPYCGVGCGVNASADPDQTIVIAGSASHPANRGKLCVKGASLGDTLVSAGRLTQPEIDGVAASWDEATDLVANTLAQVVAQHGPQAVAFYLSGQLLTEDYYVANKLMKGFIGSANVDTNSRLCMASAVAGYKRAFGEDVVPCTYADVDQSDLVILTGSNAAWAHPVLYQRLVAAKEKRGTKVVVIDPRITSTCDIADLHLAIKPGTDLSLFHGLLTYLAQGDVLDLSYIYAHTEGFAEALASAKAELAQVAESTGLPQDKVEQFFRLFAEHPNTLTLYSQGINQSASGTDKANAIINCHLATGRIGKPGQGPFSITGQPNAMGGREVGGMANQLAAHMDFDPAQVDKVQRFWGAPNIVHGPGLKAVDMFEAMLTGEIKAVWIMGTNPAVSLPDSNRVKRALAHCPFVVASDCIRETDTNVLATVLLPAQGWGEKDGTVTNSERCISRQRRFVEPAGEALPDWQIMATVAGKMGYADAFAYTNASEVFAEHARLSGFENNGERLFDLTALSELEPAEYDRLRPTYWPMGFRPFRDGQFSTPTGRAQFVAGALRAPEQQACEAFPLVLNTGRVRDQWHTMTRTGQAAKLFGHIAGPTLHLHPQDAQANAISTGDLVRIENPFGWIHLLAQVTTNTQPGLLFAPIHWNHEFAYRANVSQLVAPVVDPISGQPESKHAAVRCTAVAVNHWARLVIKDRIEPQSLNGIRALQYWAGSPSSGGWQYEFAMQDINALLQLLPSDDSVEYADSAGSLRILGRGEDNPAWLLFSGTSRACLPPLSHIATQLQAPISGWLKLSPFPMGEQDVSAMICTCFEVREEAIDRQIATGDRTVQALGKALRCGTNCGSCIPELSRRLATVAAKPPKALQSTG